MPNVVRRSLVFMALGAALLMLLVFLTSGAGAFNTDSPAGTVEFEHPGALHKLELRSAFPSGTTHSQARR
jgi:hypothetical protein